MRDKEKNRDIRFSIKNQEQSGTQRKKRNSLGAHMYNILHMEAPTCSFHYHPRKHPPEVFSAVGERSHVIVPFPSEWSPACSFAQRDFLFGRHGLWCPGVREVHPHLMMTALIRGLDPEDFALQSKSSVQSYSPVHGYILLLHGCSNRKHVVLGNSTLLGKLFF